MQLLYDQVGAIDQLPLLPRKIENYSFLPLNTSCTISRHNIFL